VTRTFRRRAALALALIALFARTPALADDRAEDVRVGRQVYDDLRARRQLVSDSPYAAVLQRVGARISQAAQPHWFVERFFIVRGNQANAYSAPGGYVFVNEGLLRAVVSVDELASVLGHETAHLVLGHMTARRNTQKKASFAKNVGAKIGSMFGRSQPQTSQSALDAAAKASEVGFMNFSRQQEYAADQKGADISAAAGFNPWGTVWFFRSIQRTEGDAGFEQFVQRHPSIPDRIDKIERYFRNHPARFRRYSPNSPGGSGLPAG
jgi:predicted Zn-dependent protease